MAFDVQTLNEAARCAECLSPNQKQNVLLYLLNGILETGGSGGGLHNLLSLTHPDTVPGPPLRGSLVVGNATPDWEALLIGAANRVLRSDGTDATWSQLALATDVTGVLPIANGGTNSSAALNNNRIMVSSAGAIVEAAALTNGQLLIGSTGAAPVAAGLTAGTNVTIGTGAGSITVNAVMPGSFSGFADPTASVGLAAVNGVATTAMRSDAAPALSQAIAPTWTGTHIFSPATANAIQINPFGVAAGNTSELRFLELAASGTNYTGFKAADAMAASEIYVLPNAAPSANRFLRAGAVAAGVSALTWAQISLTADVTGILPVANGGTGTSTAFTLGSVIFAGAAGVFTEDNANLFFDNTNNRLGVGTAVPSYTLHVFGPGVFQYGFAAGALLIGADLNTTTVSVNVRKVGRIGMPSYDGGATNTFLFGGDLQSGTNDVYFGGITAGTQYAATGLHFNTGATQTTTGGTERMTIYSNGNVGIGITIPLASLHIVPLTAPALLISPFGAAAGNTGEFRLRELTANGTNYTGFKAPDAITASEIYVLPNAAPSANRFLQAAAVAGGVSVLSWAQVSLTADVTGILPVANGGSGTSTAFTQGSVIFAGAAGVFSQDNANLFWDDAANSLLVSALVIPATSSATVGIIFQGTSRLIHTFGTNNTFVGLNSGNFTLTGTGNTSLGFTSLQLLTSGGNNVAIGSGVLMANTTGSNNVAVGVGALEVNTTGGTNVAIGTGALGANTTAIQNTAIGFQALFSNTIGVNNMALGVAALKFNTSGDSNVAIGGSALRDNTTGTENVGIAASAAQGTTTGNRNVSIGVFALLNNLTGNNNVAIGRSASQFNLGSNNVSIGFETLLENTVSNSVAIGAFALTANSTGANNLAIGYQAGDNLTTGSNNIVIGFSVDSPTATNSNTLTLGNLLFGTAIDATGVALSSGNIGIGVITPLAKFHVTNSAAATVAEIIKAAAAQSANMTEWQDSSAVILTKVDSAGNVGVRMAATALTAYLHLAAGTTAASTAPLKFTTGTLMTTAEIGAREYNGNHYLTNAGLIRFPIGGVLFNSFADASVGGAEADIFSSTLAANTFNGNGDKVVASYGGNFVTIGTESVQLKAKFAGTTIWDSTAIAISTGTTSWRVCVELIRVSSTVIRYTVSLNTTGASGFVYAVSGELTGLTLSGTNALALTGTSSGVGSGAGDIIGKMSCVEFKPAV